MATTRRTLTETRKSFLLRLRNLDDREAWSEFFHLYGRLIQSTALQAGLSNTEAQDVVQETAIAVANHIGRFEYNPERARFRTWLGKITRSKIIDQFRKRLPVQPPPPHRAGETQTSRSLPDSAARTTGGFNKMWDAEWERHALELALAKVKRHVNPKHFQIFHLFAVQDRPAEEVIKTLGVTRGQIHLVKFRIEQMLKDEIKRLKARLDQGLSSFKAPSPATVA